MYSPLIKTWSVTNSITRYSNLIVSVTDGVSTPTFAHTILGVLTTPIGLWEVLPPLLRCYRRWPTHTSICYRQKQVVLHFADNQIVFSTLETARLILGQKPTGQDSSCQESWPQLNLATMTKKNVPLRLLKLQLS